MYCCEKLCKRIQFNFYMTLLRLVFYMVLFTTFATFLKIFFYVVLFPSPVGKFRNNKIKKLDCVIKALLVTLVT